MSFYTKYPLMAMEKVKFLAPSYNKGVFVLKEIPAISHTMLFLPIHPLHGLTTLLILIFAQPERFYEFSTSENPDHSGSPTLSTTLAASHLDQATVCCSVDLSIPLLSLSNATLSTIPPYSLLFITTPVFSAPTPFSTHSNFPSPNVNGGSLPSPTKAINDDHNVYLPNVLIANVRSLSGKKGQRRSTMQRSTMLILLVLPTRG